MLQAKVLRHLFRPVVYAIDLGQCLRNESLAGYLDKNVDVVLVTIGQIPRSEPQASSLR